LSTKKTGGNERDDDKPRQPLSSYNLFFLLERTRILDGTDHECFPITLSFVQRVVSAQKGRPKRPHRKSHGKIGFRELARTVASRWKKIDDETRQVFQYQAMLEREAYEKEYAEWKESKETHKEKRTPSKNTSSGSAIQKRLRNVLEDACRQSDTSNIDALQELHKFVEEKIAAIGKKPNPVCAIERADSGKLEFLPTRSTIYVTHDVTHEDLQQESRKQRKQEWLLPMEPVDASKICSIQVNWEGGFVSKCNQDLTREIMYSPIFRDHGAGSDLFQVMDPIEMDNLFAD